MYIVQLKNNFNFVFNKKVLKKVSIKDVANLANVSIASVSYVLNKMPNNRISESTANRIKEAAEKLNYRPNKIAKSLKTNQSKILGLIVADIANPFFGKIAKILEEEALKIGYTIIIGSSGENNEKFDKLINFFIDQQVDGLILAPVENSEKSFLKLNQEKFPYIILDRNLDGINSNGIKINNEEISFEVTNTLIKKGSKKPLLVTYETTLGNLLERDFGFYKAIKENNIKEVESIKVRIDDIQKDVYAGLDKHFNGDNKPDSIFFTSNKLAFSGLKYLLKRNINIPKELQVIAFDESEAYELFPVEISYVKQPLDEIAQNALEMIINNINNKNKIIQNKELCAELILRESTN